MTTNPYTPRPWQLPHLLAAPIGGTVLLVERCEDYLDEDGFWRHDDGRMFALDNRELIPPLGPVGTVLACKEQWLARPRQTAAFYEADKSEWNQTEGYSFIIAGGKWKSARSMPLWACRLFFRTTGIDLRRTDTMTESEALAWGVSRQWDESHRLMVAKNQWLADNPGATWGDWAWFVTAERVERCGT